MNRVYDVLVVGCGISGLAAALAAAEQGAEVAVLSKEKRLEESSTCYAQGGIVARGEDDTAESLFKDILNAGSGINSSEAVGLVARYGPDTVHEYLVEKVGVPFSRDENGRFDLTREAAHSIRRILHDKDSTGRSIEEGFLSYCQKHPKINFMAESMVVDLITNSHNSTDIQQKYKETRVVGAYVLDQSSGTIQPCFASRTILATGGLGRIYKFTSNPEGATGDGLAIAYRAGAEIINAEYIQFHPTTLFHRDAENFLLTEALRGEGARLLNRHGDYFMSRYHALKDLAPRDEVSRAIWQEMEKTKSTYVCLDTTGMQKIDVKRRFPGIARKCQGLGIDISTQTIPVVPAAHYFCGGIKIDVDGNTRVPGLMAVGETACNGIHGANRLASVSLLEGLYFGIRAGRAAVQEEERPSRSLRESIPAWVFPRSAERFDPILIRNDLKTIQTTMWNYAGIIRTQKRLERALSDLNFYAHRIEKFYKEAVITRQLLELRNIVVVAQLVVRAAVKNPKSIGAHFIDKDEKAI